MTVLLDVRALTKRFPSGDAGWLEVLAGVDLAVARGEGAAVSSNFALNLHVKVGDTVTLDSPSGPVALRVVGVVTHFASPRGTIEMSRDLYKRFWHDTKVTRVFVRADPKADLASVRAAIAQRGSACVG